MGATGLRPDGGIGVRFSVASRTRGAEFRVAPRGLSGGTPPHRLRRQFGDATCEIGTADLIREGCGQRELDAGDHFGDPPGDFDQAEARPPPLQMEPLPDFPRSCFRPGAVVWAKVEGHDWWPARVVRRRAVPKEVGPPPGPPLGHIPVVFFTAKGIPGEDTSALNSMEGAMVACVRAMQVTGGQLVVGLDTRLHGQVEFGVWSRWVGD